MDDPSLEELTRLATNILQLILPSFKHFHLATFQILLQRSVIKMLASKERGYLVFIEEVTTDQSNPL